MTSEKQIAANRANAPSGEPVRPYPRNAEAEPSTSGQGAKTEAGHNRSRMNALRHGLTGQVTTMTDEDRAAHDQFSQALINDLSPEGAMETQLAQRIATDSWRLNRISAIEDNLFALGQIQHAGQACAELPQLDAALITAFLFAEPVRPYPRNGLTQPSALGQQLQLLTLYEQRINRSIQKNLAILQSLQATRKAAREAAMAEAAALLQLREIKGLEYTPAKDGSPFSNDQIHAAIDRKQRLTRASTTDSANFIAENSKPHPQFTQRPHSLHNGPPTPVRYSEINP